MQPSLHPFATPSVRFAGKKDSNPALTYQQMMVPRKVPLRELPKEERERELKGMIAMGGVLGLFETFGVAVFGLLHTLEINIGSLVGGSLITGGFMGFGTRSNKKLYHKMAQNVLPQDQAKTPWPAQTKIYAGSLQGGPSNLNDFTGEWLDALNASETESLEAAFRRFGHGLQYGTQHKIEHLFQLEWQTPVASTGTNTGWNAHENRPRMALLVSQDDPRREKATDAVAGVLERKYSLQPGQIIHLKNPTRAELEKAMGQMKAFGQFQGAEALVYFNTTAEDLNPSSSPQQGAHLGKIMLNDEEAVTKDSLKNLVANNLGQFSHISMVFDTNDAGLFVA